MKTTYLYLAWCVSLDDRLRIEEAVVGVTSEISSNLYVDILAVLKVTDGPLGVRVREGWTVRKDVYKIHKLEEL